MLKICLNQKEISVGKIINLFSSDCLKVELATQQIFKALLVSIVWCVLLIFSGKFKLESKFFDINTVEASLDTGCCLSFDVERSGSI